VGEKKGIVFLLYFDIILVLIQKNKMISLHLCSFDAIVSADLFENLKPAPDIFLAAAKMLNVPPNEVY